MAIRFGILSTAHLHVGGYVAGLKDNFDAEIVGLWDDVGDRGRRFAVEHGIPFEPDLDTLLEGCQAVVITSENRKHAELGIKAAEAGCHIICEKPLVVDEEDGRKLIKAARDAGVKLMTAFPCRFSPAFSRLQERVRAGEIGEIRAICATNRGRCPFGWFVDRNLSGGGAMIDHVVHVADLLQTLLGVTPTRVQAQTGTNMYGEDWDDTAMLTLEYPNGVFVTLDSSWSRPQSYRTWGDVTMNVVGEKGVIELNMFGQEIQVYGPGEPTHKVAGFGSNLDALMVNEFVSAIVEDREPKVTGEDGLNAARVAIAGYESVVLGQPVSL